MDAGLSLCACVILPADSRSPAAIANPEKPAAFATWTMSLLGLRFADVRAYYTRVMGELGERRTKNEEPGTAERTKNQASIVDSVLRPGSLFSVFVLRSGAASS